MELGIWIVLLMIVFMFLGMPVAFSLGVAGLIGLLLVGGFDSAFSILSTTPYRTAAHYTLTTLPMFILMAQFISASQIVDDIFHAAQRWLERLPGGLAIATGFAAAGMAAMSGSSTARDRRLAPCGRDLLDFIISFPDPFYLPAFEDDWMRENRIENAFGSLAKRNKE